MNSIEKQVSGSMTVDSVYLINKQDKFAPENNNGDWIVEAYLDEDFAVERANELDDFDGMYSHYVIEMKIGNKNEE